MIIVSAADERFVGHFAAMLHSASARHPTAEFYLMDCGIAPGSRDRLRHLASERDVRLSIVGADLAAFRDLPTTKTLSVAAYARLLIPDLFPGSVERALYIDADCIIVGDLLPLWRFDMGEAAIAAVHEPDGARMEREIGLDLDEESYINSGVMLMNLPVWRRDRLGAAAAAFSKRHKPRFIDQSGINVACAGRIAHLPERWNFLLNKPRRPEEWVEPSIIHYVGPKKPWIYSDVPFASIYLYHRNQTPFPIEGPRAPFRSSLRKGVNLLLGRRKYWDQFIIARRSQAFAATYFARTS